MSYKKITVNVTYVITQYTFANTHIYALINENPQVTTRTVTSSRHVLITVTAVTVILIRHSEYLQLFQCAVFYITDSLILVILKEYHVMYL